MTTRRSFCLAVGGATMAANGLLAVEKKAPVLVDTHLHCFAGSDDKRFPYHPRGPYKPAGKATPEHLLKCMDGAGVKYAIVVHPEPYQDDHRYLQHCLKVGKGRLKGTALLFCNRPGSLEKLPKLVKQIDVTALRVHAFRKGRIPPFGKPELRKLWKVATDHRLAVQLHFEPKHAAGFEPLIKQFPKTKVIIDHLGRPLQGTAKEHDVVVRWSRYPNTIMKMSALQGDKKKLSKVIKQLHRAYGSDRMIYGGGFSSEATPATYRKAFRDARSFLSFLSESDQNKILGENAVKLMGWS